MRLINADELKTAFPCGEIVRTEGVRAMIDHMPTVDAVRVRHGHWVRWYEEAFDSFGVAYVPHCKCSECGREYDPYAANHMNYCFECGAKIDGKDSEQHGR